MRNSILLFVLTLLTVQVYGTETQTSSTLNLADPWTWAELRQNVQPSEVGRDIDSLQQHLSLSQAQFLFHQLIRLDSLGQLRSLTQIEETQAKRGGGFYGLIPRRFTHFDQIPTKSGLIGVIESAAYLDSIRQLNLSVISNPAFQYPLQFKHQPFPKVMQQDTFSTMTFSIDFSAVDQVLSYFENTTSNMQDAQYIATNPVFLTMLEHRRNLGYIPEPLPDSLDLAYFIYQACSTKPLDAIWKWLNPWNDFCLADLYLSQDDYSSLLDTLRYYQDEIADTILKRIARVLPQSYAFHGQLGLGVNWGIRSWATQHGLGTNIVQFKDQYGTLLRTATHETFHRMQLQLCPGTGESFTGLTQYDFADSTDRKFYQVLAYVMLEGSATYVGGLQDTSALQGQVALGITLLDSIYNAIYTERNSQKADTFLNQGLKSNGPFYLLGYSMCQTIAHANGEKEIGRSLTQGAPAFFKHFLTLNAKSASTIGGRMPVNIKEKIKSLVKIMN